MTTYPDLPPMALGSRLDNLPHFIYLFNQAHREISKNACQGLVDKLRWFVDRVISQTYLDGPVVYGWTGGKESVVLEYVLRPFRYKAVCVLTNLELPIYERYVSRNLPSGGDVVTTEHDIRWLKANSQYLFTRSAQLRDEYVRQTEIDPLEKYAIDTNAGMLVVGRRRAGGDLVPGTIYRGERPIRTFAPLLELTTAEIWAIIRHFSLLEHPLYYDQPTTLVRGTGGWPTLPSWEVFKAVDPRHFREMYPYFNDLD